MLSLRSEILLCAIISMSMIMVSCRVVYARSLLRHGNLLLRYSRSVHPRLELARHLFAPAAKSTQQQACGEEPPTGYQTDDCLGNCPKQYCHSRQNPRGLYTCQCPVRSHPDSQIMKLSSFVRIDCLTRLYRSENIYRS